MIWDCGIFRINVITKKITAYYPDYVNYHKNQPKTIAISNHISLIDTWVGTYLGFHSWIAKSFVQNLPIVGQMSYYNQSIFIDRSQENFREKVAKDITDRIKSIEENPITMPKLIIFPEGTSSNGMAILPFQKGSFKDFKPLFIYAVQYNNKKIILSNDEMSMFNLFFLYWCNWNNNLTVYTFNELYDPTYLNLDYSDKNAWKIYANKCRDLIAQVLNTKTTKLNYKDKKEFGKIYKEELNKL